MSTILADSPQECDLGDPSFAPEPASIVVFGAAGDLARRKIFPALYNLERSGLLPPGSRLVGFARREMDSQTFRSFVEDAIRSFSRVLPDQDFGARDALDSLLSRTDYVMGDLGDPEAYARLAGLLSTPGMCPNVLFYLAVGPDLFAPVADLLAGAGLGTAERDNAPSGRLPGQGWKPAVRMSSGPGPSARDPEQNPLPGCGERRIIVEKPFGRDRDSARSLSSHLQERFREKDIFRIDHYLGKEAVQNLLYLRFANAVFEPVWNRTHIESIDIEVYETAGIGSRGGYYDGSGATRDMLQNHLIQLLCLTAMEPPSTLDPESIRDEKVKVLRAIPDYSPSQFRKRSLRGQYVRPGRDVKPSHSIPLISYREEEKVASDSTTETFVAFSVELDNWRFSGVPITLRTGKALDRTVSEITIHFRRPPATLFAAHCGDALASNSLVVRIQPDPSVRLAFNAKVSGAPRVRRAELGFSDPALGDAPEAYERLIADALAGDSTLFIRADESDEAWRIIDGLESAWSGDGGTSLVQYPAGSAPPDFLPAGTGKTKDHS